MDKDKTIFSCKLGNKTFVIKLIILPQNDQEISKQSLV